MSNFDVKVKINVLNQLRILRNSTFKDKLSFLDEIIQNAQRAKAKNVHISHSSYSNKMIIENDGGVLKDPHVLFSMSDSGWDEDVKQNENPFGIGFFSVITVSDYVEIFTGNLHIVFDVAKMLETNNTDIFVEEQTENYDGFKLILHNFKVEDTYYSDIKERVSLLGKYIHELNIHFNGELQEKKDLTQGDDSVFQMSVDEEALFKGWLAFNNSWSFEGVNIFYKGRLVTKIEGTLPYLKGDLHITDKALNLRAPDRKDIIRDEKYRKFIEIVKVYAQILAEDTLLSGKQQDIDAHASVLSYYGNKEELKKKMKFTVFKGNDKNDMIYLQGIALTLKKSDKEEISSLSEYEVYLRKEEVKNNESSQNEIHYIETIKTKAPAAKGVIEHEGYLSDGSYSPAHVERPEIKNSEIEIRPGEMVIIEESPTFWMKFDEIETYEYNFNIVNHYGLKLIVSRNKFEDEVLKSMTDLNVLHIKELKENIKLDITLSNLSLTPKEKRASMLLDMVSRMSEFEENVFVIGDLLVQKNTVIESLNKSFSTIEEDVTVIANKEDKKIYVDRSIIDNSMLEEIEDEDLQLSDYKFLLANLSTLIEQLNLLDIKDKTALYRRTLMALAAA